MGDFIKEVAKPAPPMEGQTWQEQALGGENPEDTIAVVAPNGTAGTVRRADLKEAMRVGFRLEHPQETYERQLEKEYGNRPVEAFITSGLSTVTGGISDLALGGSERAREVRARNEGASTLGGVSAAVLPTGLPGLLGKAGLATKGLIGAETALGRVGGHIAAGAVEGMGYGIGSGVSAVGLSKDPLSMEGAAATIASHATVGGLLGGGIGAGAGVLGEGAIKAKSIFQQEVEAITQGGEEAVNRGAYPKHAEMDVKQARAHESKLVEDAKAARASDIVDGEAGIKAEETRLGQERKGEAEKVYREAEQYIKEFDDVYINAEGLPNEEATARMLGETKKRVMAGLDNHDGFDENLGQGKFKTALQENATFLERATADAEEVMGSVEARQARMLDDLPKPQDIPALEPLPPKPVPSPMPEVPTGGPAPERPVPRSMPAPPDALPGSPQWKNWQRASREVEAANKAADQAWRKSVAEADVMGQKAESSWLKQAAKIEKANAKELRAWQKAADAVEARNMKMMEDSADLYLKGRQVNQYAQWKGIEPPAPGKALKIGRDELAAYRQAIEMGEVLEPSVQRIKVAEEALAKNRAMQEKIANLKRPLDSEKLTELRKRVAVAKADVKPLTEEIKAIRAHIEDLTAPKGLSQRIASGAGGLVGGAIGMAAMGPVGAMAGAFVGRDMAGALYERVIRKVVAGNAARQRTIKASVAKMFEKSATGVAKSIPHATKILPAMRYNTAESTDAILGPSKYAPSKSPAVTAFRERARELDSLTERVPGGGFQMRMFAKERLHDGMGLLWRVGPDVANFVEKQEAAKLAYLASKLPRNPTPPHLQLGPDTWEPDNAQLSGFARCMEVTQYPEKAVERLGEGTATPDDIDALKTVWPEHYEKTRQLCFEHAAQLQKSMPYQSRLSLSILLDIPVDPALTRQALSVYQMPKQQQQDGQAAPPPPKPLPMGMVQPTESQRMSSK